MAPKPSIESAMDSALPLKNATVVFTGEMESMERTGGRVSPRNLECNLSVMIRQFDPDLPESISFLSMVVDIYFR